MSDISKPQKVTDTTDIQIQQILPSRIHYKKCVYPLCGITSRDKISGVTFHAFPIRHNNPHYNISNESNKPEQDTNALLKQLARVTADLERVKKKSDAQRKRLNAKRKAISRLRQKIETGEIPDLSLRGAIARKVKGCARTFINMQIFHKPSQPYTSAQQKLCMEMQCISPILYRKMYDEFGFKLPCPVTVNRWFDKKYCIVKTKSTLGISCTKPLILEEEDHEQRVLGEGETEQEELEQDELMQKELDQEEMEEEVLEQEELVLEELVEET
ncbi:uncharacterized protein LOC112494857 [Cephus cinctus]|uniref:Uncharacterized protein LOC112494857 n=1 Tax=Cephus cinctus TaxID=211228 RepID=A0AAJ7W4Z2_CEPCN|nr:uncharacterized protein LOC112494857 [Cephus cinctus]